MFDVTTRRGSARLMIAALLAVAICGDWVQSAMGSQAGAERVMAATR